MRVCECMQKRNRQAGFTLPELLVVLTLTALLLSFFLQCFFTVSAQHRQRSALLELQDNLLSAMEFLTEDITKSTGVHACREDQLALQQAQCVYYDLGDDQQGQEHFYDLEGKILYRREDTQQYRQPMANFIDTLTFVYLDEQGTPTTQPEAVRAVQIRLTGCWNGRTLVQEQIVRLAGVVYL